MDLREIKGLILDMDGVLWRGDQPLLDLPAFFVQIHRLGLGYVLATNNSTRSVAQYVEKLASFGAKVEPEHILTSSMAASNYLLSRHPNGGAVYVVGETGLVNTLASDGFTHSEDKVLAVVAGMDRTLSYAKLSQAARLIREGAEFVGTNPDLTFPTPTGLSPGSGAVLAFLEAASGRKPAVMGKPEPYLYNLAIQRMRALPEEILVVGDRLDTDIQGAQRIGCPTALVLTGVSSRVDASNWQPQPDLILPDAAALADRLAERRESI